MDEEKILKKMSSVMDEYDNYIRDINTLLENDKIERCRLSTRIELLEFLRITAENVRTKMCEAGKI